MPTRMPQAVLGEAEDGAAADWKIGRRLVDAGFGTVIREKLRLHGVDTREGTSPEGEEARDCVARVLPPGTPVVVRSYASDAYGRFVADLFYPQADATGPATPDSHRRRPTTRVVGFGAIRP